MSTAQEGPGRSAAAEERATPLELFFDLVFVFAITQVTALLADDPTWTGMARGLLVLTAIWWAWAAYAWLTNEVDMTGTSVRLAMFAAMAAMLIASLAVPGAFGEDALLFALAYLGVRVLHIVVFAQGSSDISVRDAVRALAPGAILAPGVLVGAAFLDGAAQPIVWALVLAIDYAAAGVRGIGGWRLSPGYFAERHGLIVIIALGESIVAIGVGAADVELAIGSITAAALGVALAAALWWCYFDTAAAAAEKRLRAEPAGRARNCLARDSYSYLHLPMIAGIVLFALGVKKTLGDVENPLELIPAVGLCGGVGLYLAAHVALRLRHAHSLSGPRLAGAVVSCALIPLAIEVPALVAVAAVATVCVALATYEAAHVPVTPTLPAL